MANRGLRKEKNMTKDEFRDLLHQISTSMTLYDLEFKKDDDVEFLKHSSVKNITLTLECFNEYGNRLKTKDYHLTQERMSRVIQIIEEQRQEEKQERERILKRDLEEAVKLF